MKTREDFDKMINLYQKVMIEPLVKGEINLIYNYKPLECDKYDNIEIMHSYDPTQYSVRFGAVRKRPDMYMINKMYCILADVHMFDIEHWYNDYSSLMEKSKDWEWECNY